MHSDLGIDIFSEARDIKVRANTYPCGISNTTNCDIFIKQMKKKKNPNAPSLSHCLNSSWDSSSPRNPGPKGAVGLSWHCLPRHGVPTATPEWYGPCLALLCSTTLINRIQICCPNWPSELVTSFSPSWAVGTLPVREQVRGQVASSCSWRSLVLLTVVSLDPAQQTVCCMNRKGKGRIWKLGSGRCSQMQSSLMAHWPRSNAVLCSRAQCSVQSRQSTDIPLAKKGG